MMFGKRKRRLEAEKARLEKLAQLNQFTSMGDDNLRFLGSKRVANGNITVHP